MHIYAIATQMMQFNKGHSPFYQGYAIQRIDLTANTASLSISSGTGNWLRWAIPYTSGGIRYIGSDNSRDGVRLTY